MVTWYNGDATSDRRIGADISGNALLTSIEAGYAFPIGGGWALQPQGQIIWQRVDLDDTRDPFSSIGYESFDAWIGRLGLRLESKSQFNGMAVQSFVDANLWQNFASSYSVVFNDRGIATATEGTVLELGAGISAQLTQNVSGYVSLKFATGLDGPENESYGGTAGLRIRW